MDGAYTKLDSAKHIKNTLDTDINVSWDPMHKIELAYEDYQELLPDHFIENTVEIITSTSKEFKWGQNFELLLEFKDLADVLLVPKIFKDMKMVSHSQSVFKTFLNNYTIYIAAAESSQKDVIKDNLMSLNFVCDLLFLSDVCHQLALCSKRVQLSGLLPWDYPAHVGSLVSIFEEMLQEIENVRD